MAPYNGYDSAPWVKASDPVSSQIPAKRKGSKVSLVAPVTAADMVVPVRSQAMIGRPRPISKNYDTNVGRTMQNTTATNISTTANSSSTAQPPVKRQLMPSTKPNDLLQSIGSQQSSTNIGTNQHQTMGKTRSVLILEQ